MQTTDLASVRIMVYGHVQGVFFRAFVSQKARALGINGYAQNLVRRDSVEIVAEGERKRLEEFLSYVKMGPPSAKVERITTNWGTYSGNHFGFSVK